MDIIDSYPELELLITKNNKVIITFSVCIYFGGEKMKKRDKDTVIALTFW